MTRKEEIENAANAYYSETWDEHGGIAMVVGNHHHDVWFPSCATDDFFKAGAEWADRTMVEKVCQWLKEHLLLDDQKWYVEGEKTLKERMIEDLRKAMEQ